MADSRTRLEDTALRVKELTPAMVSELTGISKGKLSRFVNAPQSITFVELSKIREALASVSES